MAGGGVAEGVKESVEKESGEGGAAVVDAGTGGQAGQIGIAVGVGQVGQARDVTGNADATTADRVGGRVCAVCAVRPVRRSRYGRRGCAHDVAARAGASIQPRSFTACSIRRASCRIRVNIRCSRRDFPAWSPLTRHNLSGSTRWYGQVR